MAIIGPQFQRAFEPMSAWSGWLVPIAVELAALAACAGLGYAEQSRAWAGQRASDHDETARVRFGLDETASAIAA